MTSPPLSVVFEISVILSEKVVDSCKKYPGGYSRGCSRTLGDPPIFLSREATTFSREATNLLETFSRPSRDPLEPSGDLPGTFSNLLECDVSLL